MEEEEEEEEGVSAPIVIYAPHMEPQQRQPTPCESQKEEEKPSCVQVSVKVASDVKASISAELEAWRKLKSLKERKKQLTYYYYDALDSMSMAEMEEMVTIFLAKRNSARKK